LSFRWIEGGRLEKVSGAAPPAAPADCRELREPYPSPSLPKPADLLHLLHGNAVVERSGKALLISTDRLGLLVTREPCESMEQSNDHRTTTVRDCASPE
jgi:hypothetical protein